MDDRRGIISFSFQALCRVWFFQPRDHPASEEVCPTSLEQHWLFAFSQKPLNKDYRSAQLLLQGLVLLLTPFGNGMRPTSLSKQCMLLSTELPGGRSRDIQPKLGGGPGAEQQQTEPRRLLPHAHSSGIMKLWKSEPNSSIKPESFIYHYISCLLPPMISHELMSQCTCISISCFVLAGLDVLLNVCLVFCFIDPGSN